MQDKIRITVFCEHNQDRREPVKSVYPEGMHETIAGAFRNHEPFGSVQIATQDMSEHGLTEDTLKNTDVLVWWSHLDNPQFDDTVANRVVKHVIERGMGFLCLHSGFFSKPWQKILGIYYDGGAWGRYRTMPKGEKQRVWVVSPGHNITAGLGEYIEIAQDEMYGEPQLIPEPDRTVFISWWEGGEVCRSGCVFERGRGKLFLFTPGHEEFPIFYQEEIRLVLRNACLYLAPPRNVIIPSMVNGHLDNSPIEDLSHRK
jgi:trehalose utilization protein